MAHVTGAGVLWGGGSRPDGRRKEEIMPISALTENLAVHQSLSDEPNGDDGLTADEVKAKFD